MKYFDFAALAVFWAGVMLLTVKKRLDLKERARLFVNKYADDSSIRMPEAVKKIRAEFGRDKLERELAENLAYIKNLVVLGRGQSISTELLLTELSECSKLLSGTYLDMAHWLHTNRKDKAAECFSARFDNGFAKEIGQLLAGWEDIEPAELLSSVELYQSALREERQTRQLEKDEMISDLVYFPVVINCMAVLLNFIYVAYFLSQRESLSLLMG